MENQIIISFGEHNIERVKRMNKGKSLIDFPSHYTVIDIETTGLSPEYDSIIELSAIQVEDYKIVNTFSSLIKPDEQYFDEDDDIDDCIINNEGEKVFYIDNFIKELTGITNEMLNEAPSLQDVLPEYLEFIGDTILVGHNINFDINFIYDNCIRLYNKPFGNNYIDTMKIAKRLLKNLEHHRLSDIAEFYNIPSNGSHRALRDCEITNEIFSRLRLDILKQYQSLEEYIKLQVTTKSNYNTSLSAKDIHSTKLQFDETNPLFGKRVVFTGALEKMIRKDAMQLVADFGGINEDGITKQTNFLVLGNNDYCSTIKDGKSKKHKKAESYKLKGYDIDIISEDVFYDMISNN